MPISSINRNHQIHPPSACKVLDDKVIVEDLAEDLGKAIRKLSRDIKGCPECPGYDTCPILKSINSTIDAAIQSVQDEWSRLRQSA